VRAGALWILRELGPDARPALPALTAAANDEHPGVRAVAVQALARVGQGDPASVAALVHALRGGGDADYRWKAARALGHLGPQAAEAVPGLVAAVSDDNGHVRREAIIALGRIGRSAEAAGVPVLVRALEDPDPDIRRAAATALGRMQAAGARPALTRHLRDEDEAVRGAAQRAIEKIPPAP
jgi:HEAT repeat protein